MKNIPWANPLFDNKEFNQIKKSFQRQQFTMGKNVMEFEKNFLKSGIFVIQLQYLMVL